MDYDIRLLSTKFGAEVSGLDIRNVSGDGISRLYDMIHQYQLLVLRDQILTPEQQILACRGLGTIELHPSEQVPWKYRELTYVTNTDITKTQIAKHSGPPFELWHSDTCYLPEPARISLLYAEQVPSINGETLFADMFAAYNDLPASLKHTLEHKKAVFGSGYKLMERCHNRGYPITIPDNEMCPDVIHPVVRTHPYTKKKSIFVNWAHTDYILDMSESESAEILNYLYTHSRQDKYVYTYHPRQGDLIIWDNASLIHSNTDKPLTDIRVMRRVMIKGTAPY